ncbi:MAG: nucleotidyl transferase AbiEii/AbiGii toxin family protein [Arcobacteraceae bacterium]|nr:nucleotidyl transferase AbiEii/AbiGii toxin family protein [Arcobacteraceae bacterium]
MNLHEDKETFETLVLATAEHLGIQDIYVEKDYWVTFMLYNLHHSKYKDLIAFKGGTSLSKGYKIIDRFSEDVDLVVIHKNRREDSKNKNIIADVHKSIALPPLIYQKDHEAARDSKEYKKKVYSYNKLDESKTDYEHATSDLILELNYFFEPYPLNKININSYIYDFINTTEFKEDIKEYQLEPFELNLLCTTRTFFEKLLSLYRAAHKGQDLLVGRIRHFYDLYMLSIKDDKIQAILSDKEQLFTYIKRTIGEEIYHTIFCDIEDFLPLYQSELGVNLLKYKEILKKTYDNDFVSIVYKKDNYPPFEKVFGFVEYLNAFIAEKKI